MSAAEYQRIAETQSAIRARVMQANRPQPEERQSGPGEVIPFPVTRCRQVVDRALRIVRDYEPDAAYRHLSTVARQHRSRLRKLGIDSQRIEADAGALEAAFGLNG
jgi:hypothetical protein